MLDSIELINWKTHGSTTLAFSKGTNILIGQMGAGKSSIMDAISFALFGTFPAIKNRRVSVNDIIRNRPDRKKSAKVKLNFTIGNDSYVVQREIFEGDTAKASLSKNGAHLQSQPQRVTEEIEKALMMDYDLFYRAIYSEQNRLDYFLELRSSDRKKQIDNLLGLDKFANAIENGTSLANRVKEMIESNRSIAEGFDIEGQRKQLEMLTEERGKIKSDKETTAAELERFEKEHKEKEAMLAKMKEDYNKRISMAKEIEALKSKIEVITKEIEKIDSEKLGELAEVNNLVASIETEMEMLRTRSKQSISLFQELQNKKGRLEQDLLSISKDISERDKLLESIKGESKDKVSEALEKHKKEIENLDAEFAQFNAQKTDAERWIKELEKHISKCPVCERDLDERMKVLLLEGKEKLSKDLADKATVVSDSRKKSRKELDELNLLLNKLAVAQERLKSYSGVEEKNAKRQKEFESATVEVAKAKAEFEKASEELSKATEKSSKLKAAKASLERRESHLKAKKQTMESITAKETGLSSIHVDDKQLDLVQKEVTSIASESSRREALLDAAGKALKEKELQVDGKKKEIEKVEKLYEEIKARKHAAENLARFNNSLQETQAQLRNRLVGSVNTIMKEIWPELYPYDDYKGLELKATENDYILKICTYSANEERWEDVDTIASGGERSIACLVMRVAFALVLVPNLRWLILDEPTHNIDQLGISRFVRVFNETLPSVVEQVFIITHDEELKQVSNGKIYVLSRDKARSGESIVQEL